MTSDALGTGRVYFVPPGHMLEAIDRLAEAPVTRIRLDARIDAVQLSTCEDATGIWESVFVPATSAGPDGHGPGPAVTVELGDLRRAVAFAPSQGLGGLELRVTDAAVSVDGDSIPSGSPLPAPPVADSPAPATLELPESGPAVATTADGTQLVLGAPLVQRLHRRSLRDASAFRTDGAWFLVANTGLGNVVIDPVVAARVDEGS
jgi:hypothetical protein